MEFSERDTSAIINDSSVANNPASAVDPNAPTGPVLEMVNGRPVVSSRQVADHFGRQHNNVIRSIEAIVRNSPESFGALNFERMSIDVEIGNGATRKTPAYLLTRDGFVIVAMGFTGAKAIKWKIAYIQAFNAMEAELARQQVSVDTPTTPPADLSKLTTVEDRRPLKALVDAWVAAARTNGKFLTHAEAFRIARTPVGGKVMKQLTLADIPVAMAYVQEQLDRELAAASPMAVAAEPPKAAPTVKALPGRRRITELDQADIARRLGLLKQRTNSLILEYFEFTRELHQPFNDVACDSANYDPDVAGMMTAVNYGLQYFNRVACGNLETMQSLADFAFHATAAFRKVEHLPASPVKR